MENYKIYGLRKVDSDEIRYVGLTRQELLNRLAGHRNENRHNLHKQHWIRQGGVKVEAVILEEGIPTLREANEREQYHIKRLLESGARLLNCTSGGDGTQGKEPWNKGKSLTYVDKLIANSPRSKRILCYDLNGQFVTEYRSVKFASVQTGIARCSILRSMTGAYNSKRAGDFLFRPYTEGYPLAIEAYVSIDKERCAKMRAARFKDKTPP